PGIEPGLPACRAGVLPLDDEPERIRGRRSEVLCDIDFRPPTSDLRLQVIPDGLEPSLSWMSTRRRDRWTTGSKNSRGGSRTHKVTWLSTRPLCQHFAYSAVKWQVRVSHPAVGAYETPLGTGPPAPY